MGKIEIKSYLANTGRVYGGKIYGESGRLHKRTREENEELEIDMDVVKPICGEVEVNIEETSLNKIIKYLKRVVSRCEKAQNLLKNDGVRTER